MASTQLQPGTATAAAGSVIGRARYRVSTKKKWSDSWGRVDYLEPRQVTKAAAPMRCGATFRWRFGRVKHEDATDYKTERRQKDLVDQFVKIEALGVGGEAVMLFVGRIVNEDLGLDGSGASGVTSVARGDQAFTAIGLEYELDRSPIMGLYATNGQTTDEKTGDPVAAEAFLVQAPLQFNQHFEWGPTDVGNRSLDQIAAPGQEGEDEADQRKSYVFSGVKGNTARWRVSDVIRYLLTFHAPGDFNFTIAYGDGVKEALDKIELPRVELYGRTVFDALNDLIDRRRGLGWWVDPAVDDNAVLIWIFSLLDEPVEFDDIKLPANTWTEELNLDDMAHLAEGCMLHVDALVRYGKIIVRGERVLSCFTLDAGENLMKGWTDAEETAYKNGAGLADETDDARRQNDQARADVSLDHVFNHFHLKTDWNWKVSGGGNANPKVNELTGRVKVGDSEQPKIRRWGRRLERHLPFRMAKAVPDAESDYEKPFAMLLDKSGRWVHAHKTGNGHGAVLVSLDAVCGFSLNFTPNHRLAKNSWTGAKPSALDPSKKPEEAYDWAKMRATVAVRTDERLRVVVTLDPSGPLKDRVHHIDVPGAELHYMVPKTVKSIIPVRPGGGDDPRVLSTEDEAIVRDDGPVLRRIAAMAKAWYGKKRAAVEVTAKTLWLAYPVGTMLRAVVNKLGAGGDAEVNTVVSQVILDLANMTTTVRTQFIELDFTAGRNARRTRT